jgi:hypothetical protein
MGAQHSKAHESADVSSGTDVISHLQRLFERTDWKVPAHPKDDAPYRYLKVPEWTDHNGLMVSLDSPAEPSAVRAVLSDHALMPRFDKDCDHVELVRTNVFPGVNALRIVCKPFAPMTKARDFGVLHATSTSTPGYAFISSYVEAGPVVPLHKQYVRGRVVAYGYLVQQQPAVGSDAGHGRSGSRITMIMYFDLGGWLPNSAMDYAAPQMMEALHKLSNLSRQNPSENAAKAQPVGFRHTEGVSGGVAG